MNITVSLDPNGPFTGDTKLVPGELLADTAGAIPHADHQQLHP